MAGTVKPRRTQVEAIDALTEQIRISNVLAALAQGPSAWEQDTKPTTSEVTRARTAVRNTLRADIARSLGIELPS